MIKTLLFGIFCTALMVFFHGLSSGETSPAKNSLSVSFDLEHHLVRGISEIVLPPGRMTIVDLGSLNVLSVKHNGNPVKTDSSVAMLAFEPAETSDILKIEFEAQATYPEATEDTSDKNPGVVRVNRIDRSGISLTSGWYPKVNGLSFYHLTVEVPRGLVGVSESEWEVTEEKSYGTRRTTFLFPHPLDHINFVAAPYIVEKEFHKGIEVVSYFLAEDAGLAKDYRVKTKKYLDLYEEMISPYPFKRFAIVENVLPTGYSMPTFTLLGQEVVRLPFIVDTSLGHEILHQWFGNMVYPDYDSGNWSEGLVSYLADHWYEDLQGRGWEYRKNILTAYQSYVTDENDFPLKAFTQRADSMTGSIGYGKSAMVFHMLRSLAGDRQFFNGLKTLWEKFAFRKASWKDIREVFETVTGKDLGHFFTQWVEEKGAPVFEVKNASLRYMGSKAMVSFDVIRKGGDFRVLLPVVVKTKEGELRREFSIEKDSTSIELEVEGSPVELVLDDRYDLFRRLSEAEYPAVISRLLGDSNRVFVVPQGKEEEYATVSEYLRKEGFTPMKEQEVTFEIIKKSSLLVPGTDTNLAMKLFGKQEKAAKVFHLQVRANPFNGKAVVALLDGSAHTDPKYLRKILHYGKYSSIAFADGMNAEKTLQKTSQGIRITLVSPMKGLEVPRLVNSEDVIEKAATRKIVYVGEMHDRFEQHRVQFEVVRALHQRNKKIAIGMEMFQKPFQHALDDYISGKIEEKEFLKKSEYFIRWGFDYSLYREILLYAHEFRIPVIALNIRKEIVSKVSKEGIHSLTAEELKEVPADIDFSDDAYRSRLRDSFARHGTMEGRSFDFFYQAQVLWDESMAHGIDEFMTLNPDTQVIVLAGAGHMAFGSGIPKRTYRLNKKEYSVLLNSEDAEEGIADFLLFPAPLTYMESPKLMVMLDDSGKKVKITGFSPGSIAEKAGIKKDDIILAFDGEKVEGADDLKIALFYKKKGDTVTLTVLRKRFLFGPVEVKVLVTL